MSGSRRWTRSYVTVVCGCSEGARAARAARSRAAYRPSWAPRGTACAARCRRRRTGTRTVGEAPARTPSDGRRINRRGGALQCAPVVARRRRSDESVNAAGRWSGRRRRAVVAPRDARARSRRRETPTDLPVGERLKHAGWLVPQVGAEAAEAVEAVGAVRRVRVGGGGVAVAPRGGRAADAQRRDLGGGRGPESVRAPRELVGLLVAGAPVGQRRRGRARRGHRRFGAAHRRRERRRRPARAEAVARSGERDGERDDEGSGAARRRRPPRPPSGGC